MSKDVAKKLDLLISSIDRVYPSGWKLFVRSFLAGLYGALGATVGLAIVIAVITFILSQLKIIFLK